MIRKSGYRFSEKIMLDQKPKARWRFNQIPSRFGGSRTAFIAKVRGAPDRDASSGFTKPPRSATARHHSAITLINLERRLLANRVVSLRCGIWSLSGGIADIDQAHQSSKIYEYAS
jgi:hypothetical protein